MAADEKLTPDSLVSECLKIEDWLVAETKRFTEHIKPHKERIETIKNQLLALLNQNKMEKFTVDAGTAYKSTLMNLKVEDREKLLDFANEHWDEIGNELLMISAQKDAVRQYMDEHGGQPPPGVSTSWFTRVNIRRS